jgi:glycosyltransferase involved in cell wall biosynthesis
MHRVSVIIPVRNRETLVQKAVQSVLTQTYPVFEVIVVDDGSTDRTAENIAVLSRVDKRVRFLHHTSNRGAQAARNTGLKAAKGEWIALLDSDDHWLPNSLEVRLQLAMKNGLPIVHSECYIVDHDGTQMRQLKVPAFQGKVYRDLLRRPGPMFQGLLVRKDCFCRIGGLDENITSYQEWDTAIRLAKWFQFGFVQEPTFIYNCSHSSTISKDSVRGAQGYEQVFTRHQWSILRFLGPRTLAVHYQIAARLYSKAGDDDNARRCLIKAKLWWPIRPREILRAVQRRLPL